jgi:hypothetical protein
MCHQRTTRSSGACDPAEPGEAAGAQQDDHEQTGGLEGSDDWLCSVTSHQASLGNAIRLVSTQGVISALGLVGGPRGWC